MNARTLFRVVEQFRLLDDTMQANTIQVFLLAALEPGLTIGDIGVRLGMSQASASRNVQALSDTNRHGKPGPGLVAVHAIDGRRRGVELTERGRRLLAVIAGDQASSPS